MSTEDEKEFYGPLLMHFADIIETIIPRRTIRLPWGFFRSLIIKSLKNGSKSEAQYQVAWFDGNNYIKLLKFKDDENIQSIGIRVTEIESFKASNMNKSTLQLENVIPDQNTAMEETQLAGSKRKSDGFQNLTTPNAPVDKISKQDIMEDTNEIHNEKILKTTVEIMKFDFSKKPTVLISVTLQSNGNGDFIIPENKANITTIEEFIISLKLEIYTETAITKNSWTDRTDIEETEPEMWSKCPLHEYAHYLNDFLNENSHKLEYKDQKGESKLFDTLNMWTVMSCDAHYEGFINLEHAGIASMVPGFEMHDTLKIIISNKLVFARLYLNSDYVVNASIAKSYLVPVNLKYLEYYYSSSRMTLDEINKFIQFINDLSFIARCSTVFNEDRTPRGSGSMDAYEDTQIFRLDLRDNGNAIRNQLVTNDVISWTSKKRSLDGSGVEVCYTRLPDSALLNPALKNSMLFVKYIQYDSLVMYCIFILDNHFIIKASDKINNLNNAIDTLVTDFLKKYYHKATGPWIATQFSLIELEAITDRLMRLT